MGDAHDEKPWRQRPPAKALCMEDVFAERPVAMHLPPSILNHIPLRGWHRHVILSGEVLGPSAACVTHWAPFDAASEDPTERRLLRSAAEVKEWLANCNAQSYLPRFDFGVASCLGHWPVLERDTLVTEANGGAVPACLGQLPPRSSGPHYNDSRKFDEYEIYVANALGFPIDRYFEYIDEASFKFTHHPYLKTLRHSVQQDIARQCRDEQAKRRGADDLFERAEPASWYDFFSPHGENIRREAALLPPRAQREARPRRAAAGLREQHAPRPVDGGGEPRPARGQPRHARGRRLSFAVWNLERGRSAGSRARTARRSTTTTTATAASPCPCC